MQLTQHGLMLSRCFYHSFAKNPTRFDVESMFLSFICKEPNTCLFSNDPDSCHFISKQMIEQDFLQKISNCICRIERSIFEEMMKILSHFFSFNYFFIQMHKLRKSASQRGIFRVKRSILLTNLTLYG